MIQFFRVPGAAVGKDRPRFANGMVYTPKKTQLYEKAVRAAYMKEHKCGLYGPIEATIVAGYAIPKSATKSKRKLMLDGIMRPCKKPDADNVAKAVLDALNGMAYEDDSQVIKLEVVKVYMEEPEVQVTLRELEARNEVD